MKPQVDVAAEPTTTIIDGYVIDLDSGEVLGLADSKPEFQVNDEDSANWVLAKMMDADAEIAKEQMKLKAVQDRLGQNIKDQERRKKWLLARFGPELEQFAKSNLEGAKAKSLKLTYGTLAFRTVKGGLRVADPVLALAWAMQDDNAPDAVLTTHAFRISLLTPEQRDRLITKPTAGFEVKPDEQAFDIKSGVNL